MTTERLATSLIESALVGFVVLGCGALAAKLCRQPVKRISVIQWTLIVAIATPLLLRIPLTSPWSFAVLPAARDDSPPVEPEDQAVISLDLGQRIGRDDGLAYDTHLQNIELATSEPSAAPLQFSPALPLWQTGILALYGLVMCVLLARLGIGIAARRRLYRSSSSASSAVVALFGEISGQPGRRVRLQLSDRVQSPVMWGLWRPVIVLPSSWPKEKTARELQLALAHEWSHIEQRDVSTCYLALIAEFVCFYQPAFWWLRRKLALCQDHIADARAADWAAAPDDYASFLLSLARQRTRYPLPGVLGISSRRTHLFWRISMVCSSEAISRRCSFRWHVTTATAALLAIAAINIIRLKPVSADEPQLAIRANPYPTPEELQDKWESLVPKGALSRIEIPQIKVIEGAKDIELEEVAGWMNEIAANIQSTSSDCRTKIEATLISTPSSGDPHVNGVVAAMRIAKKPDKSLERYVVVRQKPDSNLSLVQDERLIDDNRIHADILREKGKMHCCSLTTFDYHVGEMRSEKDWDPNAVKFYQFYDPISVCTTNIATVISGNTHGRIQHMFRDENMKGTLRVGEYVHVLLECPVYSGGIVRFHIKFIATFHNGVPVQFVRIDGVDRQTGRPQVREIMRSHWTEYGEGDDRQLLPTYIVGMQQDETQVGQLEISCDWKLGREVSDSLFDVKTLGSVAPAEDVVAGIPKKLLEMLSEPSED